ncbi:uncharacterized protein L969DRAFT_82296 [Mixia osmundae IAM 14324]|uniref:uncharacterized protein n=1 Tax=Mixia osmundae (strain CBS 9802 / IAM 14324 / JCM 22182 / KY 12970) TaxID=764103 RepID=UPI0004A54E9A|nr:uncharacterized protein L969DRAFT_82296 [Mixia osmundae IAM 14324]KEI39665.1 hypothetical protein L969DRAFT_82296 [Mixia osmundae IAM 14324]
MSSRPQRTAAQTGSPSGNRISITLGKRARKLSSEEPEQPPAQDSQDEDYTESGSPVSSQLAFELSRRIGWTDFGTPERGTARPKRARTSSFRDDSPSVRSTPRRAARKKAPVDTAGTDDDDEDEPIDDEEGEDAVEVTESGATTPAISISQHRSHKKSARNPSGLRRQSSTPALATPSGDDGPLDEESDLEDDLRGEGKIDRNGVLQDGRVFRISTFELPTRANKKKVWVLSIDAAKMQGYRDSVYFYKHNPRITKTSATQQEKDLLARLDRIHANLRHRQVNILPARTLFKAFGATTIQNGKWIVDDYYEDASIAAGKTPGERAVNEAEDEVENSLLAPAMTLQPLSRDEREDSVMTDPSSRLHSRLTGSRLVKSLASVSYSARGTFAPYQAGSVQFGGSGQDPYTLVYNATNRKTKLAAQLTEENWMHQYALAIRGKNSALLHFRRDNVEPASLGRPQKLRTATELTPITKVEAVKEGWNMPVNPEHEPPEAPLDADDQDDDGPKPLGIYEPHTNVYHVPKLTQSAQATLEQLDRLPHIDSVRKMDFDGFPSDWVQKQDRTAIEYRIRRAGRRWGFASISTEMADPVYELGEPLPPLPTQLWDFDVKNVAAQYLASAKGDL